MNAPQDKPRRRTSGSENRQREKRINMRVSPEEYAEAQAAATAAGLTVSSYGRLRLVTAVKTRTRRRPTVETHLLASILAQLRKLGSNHHQILRHVNFGELVLREEMQDANRLIDEAAGLVRQQFGRGAS